MPRASAAIAPAPVKAFFRVVTSAEAREHLAAFAPKTGTETIPVVDACGRVLAKALTSPADSPHFHRTNMDGYAVRAKDTFGASASLPLYLKLVSNIEMGKEAQRALKKGEAMRIATGGMLPPGADSMIMVEYTEEMGDGTIEVQRSSSPWENILRIGEDIKKGAPIFSAEDALHRTTAEPIFAVLSAPHYHGAAMDGIAVRAEDTFGASEFTAVTLKSANKKSSRTATNGQAIFQYVDTGNPLPTWANAVVMIERVFKKSSEEVEIRDAATPWQHVRLVGEDIVATEPLLPRGHKLRPYDIGALLADGHTKIPVVAKPTVGIIPTGSELIEPGDPAKPGRIIEFNSRVTAAFVKEWEGEPHRLPCVIDDLPTITKALSGAIKEHDIVVIIAGSSAGEHDFTVRALESLGEVLVHGIDVMPGKPAILARISDKPVIGLPGYPVSAVVICQQILRPLVAHFLGCPAEEPQKVKASLPRKVPSRLGLEEFMRVSLGKVGDRIIVNPLGRGAGVITTMVKADGVLRIPSLDEGLNAGQEVEVELLRPAEEIANTILFTGSNDLTVGVLDDQLRAQYPGLKISASNVGSLGGLVAIKRGEAHIIGTHLLDSATGTYNLPDLRKQQLLAKVVVMNLVIREQGLIVPKGNPKKIKGIKDLTRKDVTFVNRQPGSGTRVLLDYKLSKLKMKPEQIQGCEREDTTHMAVAVAVASGLVDTGLGIKSAAKALGLGFVPVEREEYDLVFLKDFYRSEMGQRLVNVICSAAFKQAVMALDGYDTKKTGTVKKAP